MSSHAPLASTCPNCGASTSANYCAVCGQETRLHVASAAEFFHEFIGHYVALEGKLWQTLLLLVTRPGRLTADYIAGRRARYVAPLRVYLSLSLLFFALLKFGPGAHLDLGPTDAAAPAGQAVAGQGTGEKNLRLSSGLTGLNPAWQKRVDVINAMPADQVVAKFKSTFFSYVPYAMFLIMPLFALYLQLLYLGSARRYGEHMLFALHSNAFAFLMLGLISVSPWEWLGLLLFFWLLAYLPLAMRRVYGGGKRATLARWLVLMMMYGFTTVTVIAGVLFATTVIL
ncbi:DUF3667 domain-containing protein [Massilia sp. DWR3-1-1]|uniref:DUF3667 domain-containing protein n=1 Tax=Massilia sp. DWR3-1-1 TaxID=2804559 RepID=UPI003CED3A22